METPYREMQDRLRYLEAQEETEENKYCIMELTLAIVRTQQLLLANVGDMVCPKCGGDSWKDNKYQSNIKYCKCGAEF